MPALTVGAGITVVLKRRQLKPSAVLLGLLLGMLSGLAYLLHEPLAAALALGMLLYAIINSAGYFVERRAWPLAIMFAMLLILALATLVVLLG